MNKLALLASLVLGLLAAWLVFDYGKSLELKEEGIAYLRLSSGADIGKGERLTESEIDSLLLPAKFDQMAEFAIPDTARNREWILGRRVTSDIGGGQLLLFEHFSDEPTRRFGAEVTPGMRAMAITVNPATAVSFFVEPGSRVDILGTFRIVENTAPATRSGKMSPGVSPVESLVARTLMQNVRVLAVGSASSRGTYQQMAGQPYGTVTIEVSPEQAELLAFASTQLEGQLRLLLRNPADAEQRQLPRADWDSLGFDNGVAQ